jgi:WD40 repeat protein
MVMCLDYDPTYKYLVSGDDTGRIIIWSVKDGTIIKTFESKNKK